MSKALPGIVACVAIMLSGVAAASPVSPFKVTVEMVATVKNAGISGTLADQHGAYIRDVSESDVRLPWNKGDVLTVRWEQNSADMVGCLPDSEYLILGGATRDANPDEYGTCSGQKAVLAQLKRADGTMPPILDGWHAPAIGPAVNMLTGEVARHWAPQPGIMTEDCCWYAYDAVQDKVLTFDMPNVPAQETTYHYLQTVFNETTGGGTMFIYNPFVPEKEDEWGRIEAIHNVSFDVVWKVAFERLDVPEPGSIALAGVGMLAAAGMGRRSRRT